ncbi:MAG: electron transport complex subunit RsxC [bacterium]
MKAMTFKGGIHPPHYKETADKPIILCPIPPRIYLPMSQHIGQPARCLVKEGDRVKARQKIGEAESFISSAVHASVSGVVEHVGSHLHFTGKMMEMVTIVPDYVQEELQGRGPDMNTAPPPDEIREDVREAGIVGMGGAAFPTAVKLSPPPDKPIDSVIINGCECEPFLTADHRLMLEQTDLLIDGLRLIMHCVGARNGYIGIEDNKPDAIFALNAELQKEVPEWAREMRIEVCPLKTKYPQGGEKQLIYAILGREVPVRSLPSVVGALVQNVGTAIAISEAVRLKKPLVDRVITVTGPAIRDPQNLRVKLGTTVSWLIKVCHGFSEPSSKDIMGGPMTGFLLDNLEVPVVKGTSGIVSLTGDLVEARLRHRLPCVRCGKCADACPMYLVPSLIGRFSEKGRYQDAEEAKAMDCIECGSCVYTCPSRIPLVQLIRDAKSAILSMKRR